MLRCATSRVEVIFRITCKSGAIARAIIQGARGRTAKRLPWSLMVLGRRSAEDDGQQTELPASLQLGGRCTVAGNWLGVGGPWTSLMHACQSGAIDVVNGILAHNSTLTSLAGTHSENYSLWCVYLVNTIGC